MKNARLMWVLVTALALALAPAPPVAAQEYQLFDQFSVGLGASWLSLSTKVRVDSKEFGLGTEIDFEKDLQFAANQTVPTLSLEWRVARRHVLRAGFDRVDREASESVLTEIRFGDLVIPVDSDIKGALDVDTYVLSYTFYPVVRDRFAFGVGLGLRVLDMGAGLEIVDFPDGSDPIVLSERAEVTGPLPFLDLEVRYGITPNWRTTAHVGYFTAKIGDYDGSQVIVGALVEHLAAQHFSWGFLADYSAVDVDADTEDFLGSVLFDVGRLGLFIKGRW